MIAKSDVTTDTVSPALPRLTLTPVICRQFIELVESAEERTQSRRGRNKKTDRKQPGKSE